MRHDLMRSMVAVSMAVVLSGCYSNGRWSAPNLAFWRSSPFQSSHIASPGGVGAPVKPSGIAANSKNSSAPTAKYASTGTEVNVPPTTSLGGSSGYAAPASAYPSPQNPYPTTTADAAPSSTPSSQAPAYTASTAGVPGAGGYSAAPPTDYRSPNATPYTPPPAANNPPSYATQPTAPIGEYHNPIRSDSSYSNSSPYPNNSSYPSTSSNSSTSSSWSAAGSGTGGSASPEASQRYPETTPQYPSATSPSYNPSGTSAAAIVGDRYAQPDGGSATLVGDRYASPSATPPTAGSSAYSPPSSSYGSSTGSSGTAEYRPGSTTYYQPVRTATAPSSQF